MGRQLPHHPPLLYQRPYPRSPQPHHPRPFLPQPQPTKLPLLLLHSLRHILPLPNQRIHLPISTNSITAGLFPQQMGRRSHLRKSSPGDADEGEHCDIESGAVVWRFQKGRLEPERGMAVDDRQRQSHRQPP